LRQAWSGCCDELTPECSAVKKSYKELNCCV